MNHLESLYQQQAMITRLVRIAQKTTNHFWGKDADNKKLANKITRDDVTKYMKKDLINLNTDLPSVLQIPLNPRWVVSTLIVEKCRFMDSKKVPIWLRFKNIDPDSDDVVVLFKSGDDLRQDMLTLQIFKTMDKAWLQEGLDLRLKPYRVMAMGINEEKEGVGMVQIVRNSDTINHINQDFDGAWGKENIYKFIAKNANNDEKLIRAACENSARSCAGYVVATYVCGIGDRHSSNIMCTTSGNFFHIDFGHFLGHFKKVGSIRRERVPLVFTPAMQYVMKKHELYDR
eukprot:UN23862